MPTGFRDPDRTARIAAAAVAVVAEHGVAGLTHRRVAATAEVPLGSTTYHFASMDDLLAAALTEGLRVWSEHFDEWRSKIPSDADLADVWADWIVEATGPLRERSIVEYELYLAALRRPALRSITEAWDASLELGLRSFTDGLTSKSVAMTMTGLILHSLARGTKVVHSEAEAVLRRAFDGPATR